MTDADELLNYATETIGYLNGLITRIEAGSPTLNGTMRATIVDEALTLRESLQQLIKKLEQGTWDGS
jgi:hypothetical protein